MIGRHLILARTTVVFAMLCGPVLAQTENSGGTPVVVPTPAAGQTAKTQAAAEPAAASNVSRGQAASSGEVVLSNLAKPVAINAVPAGTLVDQVVAVVNSELVLESDVDEERRFRAFEPFSSADASSRDRVIERLIDRMLILQQAKLQPDQGVTQEDVDKQLASLRKDLPECKGFACETEAGWQKFIAAQGFTLPELEQRWTQRAQILRFIEMRFRGGVEITPAEIKDYYEKTMLPAYARAKAPAPKADVLSERIQEVLLEQRVSALLSDWLTSLKAEGTVRVMRPGEVEP